jgi:hypothetical protein
MATQFESGSDVLVRGKIVVDGQLAFGAGERVVVEAVDLMGKLTEATPR